MAILSFSKNDKLASMVMPTGYYSAEIVEIGEPQKSGSGKSFNMHSKFRIIDNATYDGKEIKVAFNTNMNNPSVMGTMFLMPHTYILQVAAAALGIEVADVPEKLDTDTLKGMHLDIKVEKVISEGVPVNTISGFLPLGAAKDATSAPF
jgi:hypothetical protein